MTGCTLRAYRSPISLLQLGNRHVYRYTKDNPAENNARVNVHIVLLAPKVL